jgi:hypothetical protein
MRLEREGGGSVDGDLSLSTKGPILCGFTRMPSIRKVG